MCQGIRCEDLTDPEAEHEWSIGHDPGMLYDCPACEGNCFCPELNEGQELVQDEETECVACAIANEEFMNRAWLRYGRR